VLCAVCCVLCAVCCVLCAVCCVLCAFADTISPNITYCVTSNHVGDSSVAKAQDVITVSLNADEDIFTPTVTCSGLSFSVAAVGTSRRNYVATRTVLSSDINTQLVCTIGVTDLAGNQGVQILDQSLTPATTCNVTIDTRAPNMTYCVSTNNSRSSLYAKETDGITITMSTDEGITVPVVTCNGIVFDIVSGVNLGTSFTATHAVADADLNGQLRCTFTFTDYVGNVGKATSNNVTSCNTTIGEPMSTYTDHDWHWYLTCMCGCTFFV
jgi:hypothetical protein